MRWHTMAPVALCLLAGATAQERTPFVSPDCIATVQLSGLAAMRDAFATTNVSELLADPRIRAFYTPLYGFWQTAIRNAENRADADIDYLVELLTDYEGRITIVADASSNRLAGLEASGLATALILSPDQKTDLAEIAAICREAAENTFPESQFSDIAIGGVTLRTHRDAGDDGVVLPTLVDGHLVAFFGSHLTANLAHFFEHRGGSPVLRSPDAVAQANVNPKRIVDLLAESSGPPESRARARRMFEAAGFDELDAARVLLSTRGKEVIAELSVDFDTDDPTGYFGAFVSDRPGAGTIPPVVPQDADAWSVQTYRLDRLIEMFETLMEEMEGPAFEDTLGDEYGIDIQADVLACVGHRVLMFTDADFFRSVDGPNSEPDGLCLGIELVDSQRMRATFERAIAHTGADVATTEHDGLTVWSATSDDGVRLHWTIHSDCALVGFGDAGRAAMLAALPKETTPVRPTADGVARRMRRAPPGWDSVTALSIRPIARAVLDVAARSEDLPPQVTQIAGMVLSVLADHELEHLVFAGGFASRTYTQRVIW